MSEENLDDNKFEPELLAYLKNDFQKKQIRNPSFSLRSYARLLKLSPASLSRILSGKRKISKRNAERILQRVTCEDPVLALRLRQTLAAHPSSEAKLTELDILKIDTLSEWYYFGILSLAETKGFRDDPGWISRRLGISKKKASMALATLERINLLNRDRLGRLVFSGKQLATTDRIRNLSVRNMNYQSLERAKDVLDRLDDGLFDVSNFSGVTMAIDPSRIAEANSKIRKFRIKLCDYLETGERTEVYRLGIQLFPLSHEVKK